MAQHTGVRYVLDTGVALKMLSQEPHLRSIITAERYVNRLNSPDAMTEAMSDGLLNAQTDPRPGELLVIDFNNLDFTMHSVLVLGTARGLLSGKHMGSCSCSDVAQLLDMPMNHAPWVLQAGFLLRAHLEECEP